MTLPRFLLVLSAQSNLLRAALVTRDFKIVSSAQQTFHIADNEFDPLELWYKTKQVVAACLDIGRTQMREIAGVAIVAPENYSVIWSEQAREIAARGVVSEIQVVSTHAAESYSGTLGAWLVWNLTGVFPEKDANAFGKTRVRAPFDAELPVVAVLNASERVGDEPIVAAARAAWQKFP